jgi:hypothetical protein
MSDIYVNEEGEIVENPVLETNTESLDDEDDEGSSEGSGEGSNEGSGEGPNEGSGEGSNEGSGEGDSDEEREAIRQRRREERRHRKEAQREREDTLKRELSASQAQLNEMRQRLESIERNNSANQLAQLDSAINQTEQGQRFFKEQIATATQAGDGKAVAEATEKLYQLNQRHQQLVNVKTAYAQRQQQVSPIDPQVRIRADEWVSKNSWYDPNGADLDSQIARQIDDAMHREGWNPRTQEYWDELNSRIKKYLPHRTPRGKVSPNKPKSVVAGSGRESTPTQNKGVFRLSPERVSALKEAGMWDDPKQRAAMIKRYQESDKKSKA